MKHLHEPRCPPFIVLDGLPVYFGQWLAPETVVCFPSVDHPRWALVGRDVRDALERMPLLDDFAELYLDVGGEG